MNDLPTRFEGLVDQTQQCWIWTGSISPDGYGRAATHAEWGTSLPHKVAWIAAHGPVAAGLELDHLCNVRRCVNPEHLEPVTHDENVRRAVARRTHCVNGHEYTDETRVSDYMGGRRCLICRRKKNAEHMRRRRAGVVA